MGKRRSRYTALRVLFRRDGKPPLLPARWYACGAFVRRGDIWWVANRYQDTGRPYWRQVQKTAPSAR